MVGLSFYSASPSRPKIGGVYKSNARVGRFEINIYIAVCDITVTCGRCS